VVALVSGRESFERDERRTADSLYGLVVPFAGLRQTKHLSGFSQHLMSGLKGLIAIEEESSLDLSPRLENASTSYERISEFENNLTKWSKGMFLKERMLFVEMMNDILDPIRRGAPVPEGDSKVPVFILMARLVNDYEAAMRLILIYKSVTGFIRRYDTSMESSSHRAPWMRACLNW